MKKLNLNQKALQSGLVAMFVAMAWSGNALAAEPVVGGDVPGTFKLPGTDTSVGFYGYVEFDASKDFKASNSGTAGYFDGGSIGITSDPSGVNADSRKGVMNMTASTSRFGFKSYTPTDIGKITTKVEGDFMGTSGTVLRLRHAFGVLDADWGSVLAGQTDSLFKSPEAVPETLDFNGTGTYVSLRKPQVRYTTVPFAVGSFGVSMEMPAYSSSAVTNSIVKAPAFGAAWIKTGSLGSVSVRALANQIAYETKATTTTDSTSKTKYGAAGSAAGVLNLGGSDKILAIVTAGKGISQYVEAANYNPEAVINSEIKMPSVTAGSLGWAHSWTPKWRSTLSYGIAKMSTDAGDYTTTVNNKRVDAGFLNAIYQATSKFYVGVELGVGKRELSDGTSGKLDRISTALHYDF